MMREMAQQIRGLIAERSAPITRRMRELPSQLEQEADVLEMEIGALTVEASMRNRLQLLKSLQEMTGKLRKIAGLIRSDLGQELLGMAIDLENDAKTVEAELI